MGGFPSLLSLRALWLTARRAGLRRSLHRLQRELRLRLLDPHLAGHRYPLPSFDATALPLRQREQHKLLIRLATLHRSSPLTRAWDRPTETVALLNQPPFSLRVPVNWQQQPIADPLWSFRLHGWEWAWKGLTAGHDRQLLSLWHHWLEHVPVGRGLAWQPYPVSRRLVVWCAAGHLMQADTKLVATIAQHAAFLADHLEKDLDNNHLVANAKALAWVGLLFPGLPQAQRWRHRGLELLWATLASQVREDGGHVENASGYHLSVWLDGLETALLCWASGEPVPGSTWERLALMGEFALALTRPDGRLPLLNDSVEDEPLPARAIFALASTAAQWPDLSWTHGDGATPVPTSRTLSDSGYAVWRSGSAPGHTFLVFDAGDLGPSHCPGHGHADALSFELWSRGEALVLDPGTYQYPAGRWRDYFRGTAAHSTATVDGLDQSCFAGPFRLAEMAHGRIVSANLDCKEPEIVGDHDGYTRLSDPVIHQRRLRFLGADRLLIEDTFSGEKQHHVVLHLHLAPCRVTLEGKTHAQATYPGGTRLQIQVDSSVQSELSIEDGWCSRTWYQKTSSPVVTCVLDAKLPATVKTLMRIL